MQRQHLHLCLQQMDNLYPLTLWYIDILYDYIFLPLCQTFNKRGVTEKNCKVLTQWDLVPLWTTLIPANILKHQTVTKTLRWLSQKNCNGWTQWSFVTLWKILILTTIMKLQTATKTMRLLPWFFLQGMNSMGLSALLATLKPFYSSKTPKHHQKLNRIELKPSNQLMVKIVTPQLPYFLWTSKNLRGKKMRMFGLDTAHRQFSITYKDKIQDQWELIQ